jgi:Ni/Co efflux regulator RcnB
MNTLSKAIILSLSSALVAAPVMATPQEHHSQQHGQQQHTAQHQTKDSIKAPQHIKKTERPSHDWQQGHKVPAQYHGNSFKVDASKYKKLSKPTKNQQWIKVNGDYVLMNTATYKVIKVIQA